MTSYNSSIQIKKCKCGCGKPFTQGFKGYNIACVPEEERQQFTKHKVAQRRAANLRNLSTAIHKAQKKVGKPKTPKKRQNKPIPKLSKTMIANLKIYVPAKREFLKNHRACEANLNNCTKIAVDVHHQKGRLGKLLYNTAYFLAVCRNCHNEIEGKPLMAKELGFSVSRLF